MKRPEILILLALVSCSVKHAETDQSNMLYYSGVSEISPGTTLSVTPSWHGVTPQDFEITAVLFEGEAISTDSFSVDRESGVFTIRNSERLSTGHYTVSIACSFGDSRKEFPKAIEIHLMKPVPDGIVVTPSTFGIPLVDILSGEEDLPNAIIGTDGSDHVAIKQFSIANVRRDGEPANECKDWFSLSQDGVFSVVTGNADFIPGRYDFDFRLTTYIVGQEDEAGLFTDALTLDVTSAPLALSYPIPQARVERGYKTVSPAPEMTGSRSGLRYVIKKVLPSNTPGISVDENSGILSFPATESVNVGEEYSVSLTVSNTWGSADFDDVFSFSIIEFIHPITQFAYADIGEVISGLEFSNPVATCDGDEVEYAFEDLPAGLDGLLIDRRTGEISCAKGIELVPGSYQVKVRAVNVKSSMSTAFTLTVIPNPYHFTFVRWGNNLGLSPVEEYGNQFLLEGGEIKVPILKSDIPDGVPVKFTIKNNTNNSSMNTGAAIDADTGELTLTYKGDQTANRSARTHASIITVTVGGNSDAAVTRKFPLFIAHDGFINGYKIRYTPFAFRVNPRTGGRSLAPVITRENGEAVDGFTLSYRRNVYFFNIDGPEAHIDGRAQDGNDRFMYRVWSKYFNARSIPVNTQSAAPVSWQADRNGERGWLGYTACYIDPADLSLVVLPDKFSDESGYASGVVSGAFQYNTNNIDPVNTGGTECYPLIIWLDPTYNK